MILAQDNSSHRGWSNRRGGSKQNFQRLDCPLNSITGYGREYFIHEVKQVLESERGRRGYYPPLEEVYRLIERQFGAQLARESRFMGLMERLNRAGLDYSETVADKYHDHQAESNPLLDVHQAYPLPWGTVFHYLTWKLPRMIEGDSFRLDCLTFERLEDYHFSVQGRGTDQDITGGCEAELTARVLMVLRSAAQIVVPETPDKPVSSVPDKPVSARMPPVRRGVKPAPLKWLQPAPLPEPLLVSAVKLDMHKPLPPDAPTLPPLPVLTYTRRWEMEAIAERYLEQGYPMAQIQAALVRIDLAANGGQDVQ